MARALAYALRIMRAYVPETVRATLPPTSGGDLLLSPPAATVTTPVDADLAHDGRRIVGEYTRATVVVYSPTAIEDMDVYAVAMAALVRDGYASQSAAGATLVPRGFSEVLGEWYRRVL